MTQLKLDYILWVFTASCGILQWVASANKLKGLTFFPKPIMNYIFSLAAVGGSFYWFFLWDNRLAEKIMRTGLEGKQQFYSFLLAVLLAVVFTVVVSSWVRAFARTRSSSSDQEGLDALREMSYFVALRRSFRQMKKEDNDRNSRLQ